MFISLGERKKTTTFQNGANRRTCKTVTGTLIPNSSNSDIIPRFRAINPTRFDCGVHFPLLVVFALASTLEVEGVGVDVEKSIRDALGIRSIRGR